MKNRINTAYFLIPVLYVLAIIFLFYSQFSGSHSINTEISGISISGQTKAGAIGEEESITELTITYMGVTFSLSQNNPFLVYSQDGLIHKTQPTNYRVTATGIDIFLTKGIICSFYKNSTNSNWLDIVIKVEDPASVKTVRLPITNAIPSKTGDTSTSKISLSTESNNNYCLTIPKGSYFDTEKGLVVIKPETDGISKLSFEQNTGYGMEAFSFWKSKNSDFIEGNDLKNEIDSYIEKSRVALLNDRLNTSNGTWIAGSKRSMFYEDALLMATSEIIDKSDFDRFQRILSRAATMHREEIGLNSSCLYGNIVNEGWTFNEKIKDDISNFLKRAENRDYSVFSEEYLIPTLFTTDSNALQEELLSMVENIDTTINVNIAIDMLYFYSSLYELNSEIGKKFSKIAYVIDSILIPSLAIIENRPYIIGSDGGGDIQKSLSVGIFLFNKSPTVLQENYSFIGRELVYSVLLLADEQGLLPQKVSLIEEEIQKEGVLRPESIYTLLTTNTFYPSIDYFFLDSGKTISVLNQTDNFIIEETSYGYKINFDFPRYETHSFAIRNIEPFNMLYLFGGRWASDHRFQSYSSGWWYDRQHNTLFVKIQNKSRTEEIRIYKN